MKTVIVLASALVLLAGVGATYATPYYIAYEAETPGSFPEDEGWERHVTGGGVDRSMEDGIFTLQAVNPLPDGGSDQYLFDMQEQLNPDPGEFFFAEWRMRLLPDSDSADVSVAIAPDGMVSLYNSFYSDSAYWSSRDGQRVDIDTTVFHTFRMKSFDMVDYTMTIDGEVVWEGFFAGPTGHSSFVLWGDGGVFGASRSEWDYFRFGVVPVSAPGASPLLAVGLGIAIWSNKRKRAIVPCVARC